MTLTQPILRKFQSGCIGHRFVAQSASLMKICSLLLSAAFWFGSMTGTIYAASPSENFDLEAIDSFVATTLREKKLPGLSLAVMKEGQVVLARAYGWRSLELREPAKTDTQFAIGSVSKQFTCACILLLVEEGKLSVQ